MDYTVKGCMSWPILPARAVATISNPDWTTRATSPSSGRGSPRTQSAWTTWTGSAGQTGSAVRTAPRRRPDATRWAGIVAGAAGAELSVTSGTIFDKTRIPLSVWFEVVWLVTSSKTGVPAAHLHRVLPISSYQSAWAMLARLRQVMTSDQSALLSGRVEVDETFIGGPRPGVRGRGALGKTLVAGAIEITDHGWGRARMGVIEDATTASLKAFAAKTIATDSVVVTDGLRSYPPALHGYEHEAINVASSGRPAHESLPAVHRLFALAKRTLEGTYQGAGTGKHLPEYLDEFVFRFNRRNSRHRGLVFLRLLERAVDASPVTYRDLVRDSQPKKTRPQGRRGPRSRPSSLDQATSPRPWRRTP